MRKIFTFLLLSLFAISSAEAYVYRYQPNYSFRRSVQNKPRRFVRSQWQGRVRPYSYRFHNKYQKTDYERWRNRERSTPSSEPITEKGYGMFCNYADTIIGEYLPTQEVTNRCCTCFDGWKCQIPATGDSTRAHPCDLNWAQDNGYISE